MHIERDGLHDPGTADSTMPGANGTWRNLEHTKLRSRRGAAHARAQFEPFRIDVHPEDEAVRVAPLGELDLATAAPLKRRLDELRASGCWSVVLDLRGLTFIDASGLRLIVSSNAQAFESQIEFAIIQGPPAVRRVFEMSGLLNRLPFRPMGAEDGLRSGPPPVRSGRMPAPPHRRADAQNASTGGC